MATSSKAPAIRKTSDSDRYVVPNKERGGWDVVKQGDVRATAHTAKKADAVNRAREILRKSGGGELRIMNETGKLTESDTIPAKK